mgnify:CR=1 FL=1
MTYKRLFDVDRPITAIKKTIASAFATQSNVPTGYESQIKALDEEYKKYPNRWKRIKKITNSALQQAGISSGIMLEIGGRVNPRRDDFPTFEYQALDLAQHPESTVTVTIGDITNCPQIPDNTYDFIFSVDVFEHINRPWLAGSEIARILKPGGVTVHSTLFAWRYHPCPGDYFRYTPEGLASLFPVLECIHKSFDYAERRRNMLGKGDNKVVPDAFGGWRENVRVNYAGIKR